MKKFLLSILTILYMTMSSGIAMDVHYCMGKKAGFDLFKSPARKCSQCGMKNKGGCCHDEHKFFKLSTEYKNVPGNNTVAPETPGLPVLYSCFTDCTYRDAPELVIRKSSPPYYGPPIFIRNCIFRI